MRVPDACGRDGSVAWVHDEGVLVRDADGAPLCLQGYVLDITERKQREAALLASDAIVASSFDAIVSRTTDGIVTGWNGAAERLFGYSAEEMIGRSVDMLLPDQSGVLEYVDAQLRRGEIVDPIEVVCLRKDGTRVEVESTVSPIVGALGRGRRLLVDHARHHRAQARAGARRRPGGAARASSPAGRRCPRCSISSTRFVEAARRGRARLDPAARPRRHPPAARRRPEPAGRLLRGDRRHRDRAERRILRHRRLPARAACAWRTSTTTRCGRISASWRPRPGSAPAGRRRSSRPTARCSARSRSTTATPREPGERDRELVELATHVAGIAIERARSEEAAEESEERYRDLFENANEPIATVTMDECITEVNRAFERVLGYSREELIGTNLAAT